MSGHGSETPLSIRPTRSGQLAGLLVALHAGSLVVVTALPLHWLGQTALALLVLINLSYQTAVHLLRCAPWAIHELIWQPDDSWVIRLADGRELEARLAASTFVGVNLIVLNLRRGRLRTYSLPLLTDSLDAEQRRRLRARLRLRGSGVDRGTRRRRLVAMRPRS